MKARKSIAALALACLSVESANAGVTCTETVTNVITHSSGAVYFQTDKTCAGAWCQLSFANDAANKNAYAMLLTARTTGKQLTFTWVNISSCTAANPLYASPDFISFNT